MWEPVCQLTLLLLQRQHMRDGNMDNDVANADL